MRGQLTHDDVCRSRAGSDAAKGSSHPFNLGSEDLCPQELEDRPEELCALEDRKFAPFIGFIFFSFHLSHLLSDLISPELDFL